MPYICLVTSNYDDAVAQGTFVIDDIRPDASQVSGTYANTALGPLRPQVSTGAANIQSYLEAQVNDAVNYAAGEADADAIASLVAGGSAIDAATLNALAGGDLDLNNGQGAYVITEADVTEILAVVSGDTGYDRAGGRVVSSGALAASAKNGKLSKLIDDGDVVIYNDDGSLF